MFNRLQMQEALKNPGITQQRLGQYQSPMSPNPQVRPDDAEAEEVRRAQRIQSAMGEQAAAMGDPAQTPSIMAKTMMENAQLKKMLAAMQQRQQPMQVPQARGLESLPAPAVEKGYAGGGIVAFDGGGKVERYQSQGFVMPPRYKRTEYFDIFGRNERLGGAVDFDEEKLKEDEQELARIKSGLASGSITNPAALGKLAALERDVQAGRSYLAQRNAPQAQAAPAAVAPAAGQRAPSVGDTASLGLDRGVPAAARQRQQQSQGAGLASITPSATREPTATGIDFPSAENASASAGLRGELERIAEQQKTAAQEQGAVGPELTQEARLRQALAARRTLMQELGLSGGAGDELRAQAEEMKAAQAKYKEQAGLAGLANVLAAYGAAPRKRAAGAAGQAAAQFVSGQQDAERKFEMDMAALKASATRADRAEKRGDLDAVMKENQFQETLKAEMDRVVAQLRSRETEGKEERALKEREGALDRQLKERMLNLEIKSRFDLEKLSSQTKLQIANMAPDTLRVIDGIAQRGNMSFNDALDKFLTKGKSEVSAADRARLAAAFNDLPRSERDKYNGVEDFIAQMTGGAGGMPAGVTVKKKD
jgi:hypothetical protein